jgi:hypothetical protein
VSPFIKHLYQFFLIKEDEAGTVFYFLIFFLVIGFGMALGNATASALFLKRFGIDYLPLVYLAQGGACFVAMVLYASVADVISAERFFKILFAVLAALVLGFWALISMEVDPLVFPVYFLFYEVVSEILLVHSALYLNQNINTLQAKRLSPIIFSGLQIGTIMGGLFLAAYAPILGTSNILTVWFILLLLALVLIVLRHQFKGASPYFRSPRKSAHKMQQMATHIQQGFRFTWDSELLRVATIAMVFMVITYYIINYSVKRIYTESYALESELTAFFGVLTTLTSTLALVVQLFLTNRLIERFGVPTVNLFYPLASLGSFIGMIFHLGMPTAIISSMNINAVMPAFHNPVRTMFLNVLPQQIQGRARAMTMAIVLPVSLSVCGILLWFLQKLNDPLYFLIPGATAAGLFFYFSIRMNHAYGKTLLTHLKEHLFLPDDQSAASLKHTGNANIESIVDAVSRGDESSASYARLLADAYPEDAAKHILPVIKTTTPYIASQLLRVVLTTNNPDVYKFLIENPNLHDNHFRADTLRQLINVHMDGTALLLQQALDHPDPRIMTTAIHGVLSWPLPEHQAQAIDNWISLLEGSENKQLAALDLIPNIKYITTPETRKKIEQACHHATVRIFATQNSAAKIFILNVYRYWQGPCDPDIQELIIDAMENTEPGIRVAAAQCVHIIPQELRYEKLECALDDGHIQVRNAAVDELCKETPDAPQLALKWIIEDNRGTPRAQETLLNAVINAIPQSTLALIIDNKIKDARQIHSALVTVREHRNDKNNNLKLLQHLLEERFQQILEIALTAMEPLCARNVISIIRAGIRTLDECHMANACEALHSIPNQTMTQPLGQLIQDAFMPSSQTVTANTGNLETVLEVLVKRPDAWLHECARSALFTVRGSNSNG